MTGKKNIKAGIAAALILCAGCGNNDGKANNATKIIHPSRKSITETITCTGTVEPKNRLEIKPTINGRVDRILVREGQAVRTGSILLWMSSEERAALIDAARAKSGASVKYWQEAYKPIPILSPITGTVIVRDIEPGQSVTSTSVVLVISDRLIVRATVDETDIGKVRKGQEARITLDAYPEVSVKGQVQHISYESEVINNVTTYEVDIIPRTVPQVFRSGMTADITIISAQRENILTLPSEAVHENAGKYSVKIMNSGGRVVDREVKTGLSSGNVTEIISGIGEDAKVVVQSQTFQLPPDDDAVNPFHPGSRIKKKK